MEMDEQRVREIAQKQSSDIGCLVFIILMIIFAGLIWLPKAGIRALEQRITVLEQRKDK